jgi:hypothetical protein
MLADLRELDDRLGSAPVHGPAVAQTRTAEHIARETPGRLHVKALSLAAEHVYFCGWLADHTGQFDRANKLYDRALTQAVEVGNPSLVSELLSMKGYVAWKRGDLARTIRLSQAAQRDPAVFPTQHAISAMQEARTWGAVGDASAADRKLMEADALIANSEHCKDRPVWLYYHTAAFFAVQRGRAWLAPQPAFGMVVAATTIYSPGPCIHADCAWAVCMCAAMPLAGWFGLRAPLSPEICENRKHEPRHTRALHSGAG